MRADTFAIQKHRETNHFYDTYLPYEFHLRMVHNVFEDFKHLLDDKEHYYGDHVLGFRDEPITLRDACDRATWGHDLIEDCRVSYNDCKNALGQEAADIIYAVSNEKGKNRAERANDKYYAGIRNTKGAVFVKLCDRIANVQYSKLTKSRMFETYKAENGHFIASLNFNEEHEYISMFNYLKSLYE